MTASKATEARTSLRQKAYLSFFGLILVLIIVEAGMRLAGFFIVSLQEYKNLRSSRQKGSYRIMCLGESTTQGQWPGPLEEILNQSNIGIKFSVIDKGISGANSLRIVQSLQSSLDHYEPDMIVVMMGINDFGPHIPVNLSDASRDRHFYMSLKLYRLLNFLKMHIAAKFRDAQYAYSSSRKPGKHNDESRPQAPDKGFDEYLEECRGHRDRGDFSSAEAALKKAIEVWPNRYEGYAELGNLYCLMNRIREAEAELKKPIESEPVFDSYMKLGEFYIRYGDFGQAEQAYRKAAELEPDNYLAFINLTLACNEQAIILDDEHLLEKDAGNLAKAKSLYTKSLIKRSEADAALAKAAWLNPGDYQGNLDMGCCYLSRGDPAQAETLFRKLIAMDPERYEGHMRMGEVLRFQGRFLEAELFLQKALGLNSNDRWLLLLISGLYRDMKKPELAEQYEKRSARKTTMYYDKMTSDNYLSLKRACDERGIRLVCMQYPVRSLVPLKSIFRGREDGVVFVDNEQVFKDALRESPSKEYFRDMFAGVFGHCTDKGNRLIAENAARTILKEVFGK